MITGRNSTRESNTKEVNPTRREERNPHNEERDANTQPTNKMTAVSILRSSRRKALLPGQRDPSSSIPRKPLLSKRLTSMRLQRIVL